MNTIIKSSTFKANTIKTFSYTGTDHNGRKVKGECRGKTISAVQSQLRSEGIIVKKIHKSKNISFTKRSIKLSEISLLTRQLSTMISSGVPLIQSIEVCMRANENPFVSNMLAQIKSSIENGHSLSEALALYPEQFNLLYRNLLSVGENSGTLDTMLLRVADHQEKIEKLKKKFKKALFYPASVLIVSLAVTAILLIYVVPQFESMFNNFNAKLPWFTILILNISEWLQIYWYYLITIFVTTIYLTKKYIKKYPTAKSYLDNILLQLPLIGNIINKICIARFTRTLHTMLSSGIPLLNCLPLTAEVVDNSIYKKAITDIKKEVEGGQSLSRAMSNTNCFSHIIVQMTAIGESSGTLDQMLLKIAQVFEEDIDNTVDNLSSIIEPVIIVILSVVVGGLIVAMYLPIFTLGSII